VSKAGVFLKKAAEFSKLFRHGSGISARARISCGSELMTGLLFSINKNQICFLEKFFQFHESGYPGGGQ